MKQRNSNFELMRIISMILIIIYHCIYHGEILEKTSGSLKIILTIIMSLTLVHVNSFILLSGYFQHNKKCKFSKVISLNNTVWFYTVIIAIIAAVFLDYKFNSVAIFKFIMPINYDLYWFIREYLILYLISPIINIVIQNINQKQYKKILLLLFIIISFLPFVTDGHFFNVNRGYRLYYMIFLYFLGAYLNIYPIRKNYIFKKYKYNFCTTIFLFSYIFLCIINVLLYNYGYSLLKCGELFSYFGKILINGFLSYNNPLILLSTLSYFLFFESIKFNNKLINKIAATVFGTYLIHENNYIKIEIFKLFRLVQESYSYKVIIKIFIASITIFIACTIIEFIRQLIFKFIYKLKISKKIRFKCVNFIDSLGIKINW